MASIIYLGMDVHSTNYTLCTFSIGDDRAKNMQTVDPDFRKILKYMETVRTYFEHDGDEIEFVCGYEAGCLGYTLYHQLTSCGVKCIILAPTTMASSAENKVKKNDKRDAERIAKCLAYRTYSEVHIPTQQDDQIKEYIRMRDDHKLALKKIKQQILAFCLRHGSHYSDGSNWTQKHVEWLKNLSFEGIYQVVLDEYLLTYNALKDKIERLDKQIEDFADLAEYKEKVRKLSCFIGVSSHVALSMIVEVGDFNRFPSADKFAAFLGLVPIENSSGNSLHFYGITKAGNRHVRTLLVESAQCYSHGKVGYKSKALKTRQAGNTPQVIAYADKANERLRRKYYSMIMSGKKANVAKTAIARELACFAWGMMTGHTS